MNYARSCRALSANAASTSAGKPLGPIEIRPARSARFAKTGRNNYLDLRAFKFCPPRPTGPSRRRWGFMYYIYLAVTFAGVTDLVFLCLVALEMVIG